MNSLKNTDSKNHTATDKNLVAACGLFCGSCGIYLATQENNSEKLLQYAIVLNQSFGETLCDGCKAVRKSAHCYRNCLFVKCTQNRGIEFCGTCREYPCNDLTVFQSKMPHRIEIYESLNRLNEIGCEQWLVEMKQNYSCPQCNTANSAYDIACRKCGFTPGCRFVDLHKDLIDRHMSKDQF